MNADDRGTTPPKGLFTPREPDAAVPATGDTATPRVPQRSAFRPVSAPPVSEATPRVDKAAPATDKPRTTNFQWPGVGDSSEPSQHVSAPPAPGSALPRSDSAPASRASAPSAPGSAASSHVAAPPAPGSAPAKPASAPGSAPSAPGSEAPTVAPPGAFSVGVDRVRGIALRARDSLTEGDDIAASSRKGGPRKARVLVSRVDPWSVLKMGFLLSVAAGIMAVVAAFVIWNVLNQFGLFVLMNEWIAKLFEGQQKINIEQIVQLNKVMSATVLISVVNVILLTALSTIGAFLYNTVSSVVGGIYVTLTDD